jgi:hypothetical protein
MVDVNVREQNKKKKLGSELSEFISDLREKISKDNDSRSKWREKLGISSNQRLGVKRPSRNPWPGAPNIPIQEADKQIRKRKPNFVLAVIGQGKPVNIDFGPSIANRTPEMEEKRRKSELAMNFVLMNNMDLLKTVTIGADQFLEKGHCIFKVIEEFKTEMVHKTIEIEDFTQNQVDAFKKLDRERQKEIISARQDLDLDDEDELKIVDSILSQFNEGLEIIEYDQEIITSMPKILVRDAEKIIVPSYTTEIDQSERIVDEFYLSERELMDRALNGAYDISKVKKAIDAELTSSDSNTLEVDLVAQQKSENEGITNNVKSELFKVWEVYTWRPTGPKGKYERWVFTILPDVGDDDDATIQTIRFPYEFTMWNFVKHDNELKDSRYYSSRGIPEQIRALQEIMEKAINNMLHRDQINNSPMYTILTTSKIQPGTVQFIPGQRIRVNRHDEIQELSSRTGKIDLSSVQIFQILKGFLEEYIGSTDQLFRNSTNAGGGKTLGEIKAGIALSQNLQSIELMLWNDSLKKVYDMVWEIMKDRLGDPINVMGEIVTKEDFNFDAIISPTGTLEALDKQQRLSQAFNRVNLIVQQIQLGVIADENDLYNVMNDFLAEDGVKNPDRYITRPEIIQQKRQQQAQAQQQLMQQQEQELAQEEAQLRQRAASEAETVEPVQTQQ